MTVTLRDDGTTSIVGPVVDASALFGLLARLRDLGATLLQVERPMSRSAPGPRWVSRAIVIQVVVVSALALVVLVLAAADLFEGALGLGWAVGGLVGGAVVGVVASRMKRMQWDERTGQVISKIDWLGGVILVCFLVAQLTRSWLLGHWVEGVALTTLGLCVTAGTLAGQVLGTRRAVRAVRRPV